jgi:hypothetical protein
VGFMREYCTPSRPNRPHGIMQAIAGRVSVPQLVLLPLWNLSMQTWQPLAVATSSVLFVCYACHLNLSFRV